MTENISSITPNPMKSLAVYRASIDNFDAALIHILAERFRKTRQVGELKAKYDLVISDSVREREQVIRLRKLAKDSGLDQDFAEKYINFLISEVIQNHKKIATTCCANP